MERHASDDGPSAGRHRRRLAAGLLASALLLAVGGAAVTLAGAPGTDRPEAPGSAIGTASPAVSTAPAPPTSPHPSPAPSPAEFSLLAAGDILPHRPVVESATADAGTVDFSPLLAGLDRWVRGADLALCHLETPVAPRGTEPSGYPVFGAPRGMVRDLAEQGWDGCSTASNHALDRGEDGVRATLGRLDAAGMGHAGTARSPAEQGRPQLYVLERAGRRITVAHLAATYGLNGSPGHGPWAVDLIDGERLVARARAARDDGADVVVVSLHAGAEYTESLTDQQDDVVRRLARSRQAELVLGHHAHVPQAVDRVGRGPDGDGMWVAYGLGNLLSNQSAACCDARTNNGVLLSATFRQDDAGGPVRVTDVRWTGVTVDIGGGHRLHALPDALAAPGSTTLAEAELKARQRRVHDAVGGLAAQRLTPDRPTGPAPRVVPRGG